MASTRKAWNSFRILQSVFVILLTIVILALIYYTRESLESSEDVSFKQVANYKGEDDLANQHPSLHQCNNNTYKRIKRNVKSKNREVRFYHRRNRKRKLKLIKVNGEDEIDYAFNGHKIVHLDLKGAPPKMTYLNWFFPFIKKLGATGVLIEYEDMFPYTSVDVSANSAYTTEDIANILKLSKDNSLELIPLIQTFGHMEFVLKLQRYKKFREEPQYPQSICPTKEKAIKLLKDMIDDIMEAHKGHVRYLHIGCDEVYQIGKCKDCFRLMSKQNWSANNLFLNHVTTIAKYIRSKYSGVTPLIWDDQLRSIPELYLLESNLGELVEPVVWKYGPNVDQYLSVRLWNKYSNVFNSIWFASSFKGSNQPDSMISPIRFYFANHKSWKYILSSYSSKINFKGGILTGWQRFDHFSVLCELLPVAIPSLAINLLYLSSKLKSFKELSVEAQKICGCKINELFPVVDFSGFNCRYPGSHLHQEILNLTQAIHRFEGAKTQNAYKGWMTDYNIENSFSSPLHIKTVTSELLTIYMLILSLETSIKRAMEEIYSSETIDEWVEAFIRPHITKIKEILDAGEKLLFIHHWPKRPLG